MLSPGLPAWLAGTWNIHPDIKIWAICVCCSAHLLLNCLILFNVGYFQRNIATFIMLIHVIRFHHSVEILFKLKLQFLIRSIYQKGSPTCSASSLMYSSFFLADSILKMKKCLVYDFDIWTSPSYFLPKIKNTYIYIRYNYDKNMKARAEEPPGQHATLFYWKLCFRIGWLQPCSFNPLKALYLFDKQIHQSSFSPTKSLLLLS